MRASRKADLKGKTSRRAQMRHADLMRASQAPGARQPAPVLQQPDHQVDNYTQQMLSAAVAVKQQPDDVEERAAKRVKLQEDAVEQEEQKPEAAEGGVSAFVAPLHALSPACRSMQPQGKRSGRRSSGCARSESW
jgi:hypothetical protein